MRQVKTMKVKGMMKGGFRPIFFTKEVRVLSEEEALEKIYNEVGNRNKLKRTQIEILNVEEIDPKLARDPIIRALAEVGGA